MVLRDVPYGRSVWCYTPNSNTRTLFSVQFVPAKRFLAFDFGVCAMSGSDTAYGDSLSTQVYGATQCAVLMKHTVLRGAQY
eukprot:3091877-Rhodomonas_salina.2